MPKDVPKAQKTRKNTHKQPL